MSTQGVGKLLDEIIARDEPLLASQNNSQNRKTTQLKNLNEALGIIQRAKRTVIGARCKVEGSSPPEHRYGLRLSRVYDELKSIQDDISRRYFT